MIQWCLQGCYYNDELWVIKEIGHDVSYNEIFDLVNESYVIEIMSLEDTSIR